MAASTVEKKNYKLYLIGKTGTGKSATGNSILGFDSFKSSDSMSSVTKEIRESGTKIGDKVVKVIDSPGLLDTDKERSVLFKDCSKDFDTLILKCPNGLDAFLFVVYLGKFGKVDEGVVTDIKKLFGDRVFEHHVIIVITHADDLSERERSDCYNSDDWVNKQEGPLKNLIVECKKRYVYFDNTADVSEDTKEKQRFRLFQFVDDILKTSGPYTNKYFEMASDARKKYTQSLHMLENTEELIENCQFFENTLNKIEKTREPEKAKEQLNELAKEIATTVDTLEKSIEIVEKCPSTIQNFKNILDRIKDKLEIQQMKLRLEKESESNSKEVRKILDELKKQNEKKKAEFEHSLNVQRSEYQNSWRAFFLGIINDGFNIANNVLHTATQYKQYRALSTVNQTPNSAVFNQLSRQPTTSLNIVGSNAPSSEFVFVKTPNTSVDRSGINIVVDTPFVINKIPNNEHK